MELKSDRLLFLYKSPFFIFTKFYTNDNNLKSIANALNIKSKRARINYVYDEAIRYINKYYSKDLCQFVDNKCIAARKSGSDNLNGCCRLCMYQDNTGCKVCNMSCKLFYCGTALGNLKKLEIKDIPVLKCLNRRQRFLLKSDFFATREEVLKDLYYGIVIATVRMLFRMGRQFAFQVSKFLKR